MSYSGGVAVHSNAAAKDSTLRAVLDRSRTGDRQPVVGSWLMLPGHLIARAVAQSGFHWALVDCEHGAIDDADMHRMVAILAAYHCSPIVRIAAPEAFLVKRSLDAGAHGIMVPLMTSVQEVERLVSFAKFPVPTSVRASNPDLVVGIRGAGSPFSPPVFGQGLPDYISTANQSTLVIIQIETKQALDCVEDIAKVPGCDALFVGPNDLCSQMGFRPSDHPKVPEVQEAIKRILKAAHDAGKPCGMFCMTADEANARFAQGFDFCNVGIDYTAVTIWNATELAKIKPLTKV